MATDHYTRLGIEKEKFYELDEKGKEELVEKQFRGSTGNLLSKLFDIFFPDLAEKRLVKLRDARDILKDERVRKYYDFSLENGEKPNVDYKSLRNHLDSSGVFNDLIEKQQKKLDNIKSQLGNTSYGTEDFKKLEAKASHTEKILEKLNKTKSVIEEINKERIEQIKENLKSKAAKINDFNLKLEGTKGRDNRNNIKSDIVQIANERSKLLKELNGLDSKQPKKEVGQQTKPDAEKAVDSKILNIPLTDNVKKLVSNASEVNQSALLPKSSKAKPVVNMPIISPLPSVQKLIDQHETSRVDGTKLNHESKPDINNNTQGKFTQQISQEREVSEQQNGKSI